MIAAAKTHVRSALVGAGLQTQQVVDGAGALARIKLVPSAIVHWRAVDESLRRDGTLVDAWTVDDPPRRVRRHRLWRRSSTVMVELREPSVEAADTRLQGFLRHLGAGCNDEDQNWIAINVGEALWSEDKAQTVHHVTVSVELALVGGIYKDTPAAMVKMIAPTPDIG